METIHTKPSIARWLVAIGAIAMVAFQSPAYALNSILNNFNNTYPASSTGANANCGVCHLSTGGTGGGLNEYGFQLQQANRNFAAIEGLPSANVDGGTTMLDEINASTQPGWTTGANNNTYDFNGLKHGVVLASMFSKRSLIANVAASVAAPEAVASTLAAEICV